MLLQKGSGPGGGKGACRKEGGRAGLLWLWAPWPRARGDHGARRHQAARPGLRFAAVRSFRKAENKDSEHRLARAVGLTVPRCVLYMKREPIVPNGMEWRQTGEGGTVSPPAGLGAADLAECTAREGRRQVDTVRAHGLTLASAEGPFNPPRLSLRQTALSTLLTRRHAEGQGPPGSPKPRAL